MYIYKVFLYIKIAKILSIVTFFKQNKQNVILNIHYQGYYMKKKTCRWLDSNTWGGIQILDNGLHSCCNFKAATFYREKDLDYSKISIEELMQKRTELAEAIAQNKACIGCEELIEKEEDEISVKDISYLSIGMFSTCNLRCKYCYFTHEQLGKKLSPERAHLLPFVKKLAEAGFLKEDITMGVAGGEPTLVADIVETCKFLEENYSSPSVILLSNSSIESKTGIIAQNFKNFKKLKRYLYTSIDAGTRKTYKLVRGRDLFESVEKNLIRYAKEDSFDGIKLKYLLLYDGSNTTDRDIFGFLNLYRKVLKYQKGIMFLTIDCDMYSKNEFDEKMVAAAGKLLYVGRDIFKVNIEYIGGGITPHTKQGKERIRKVEQYANEYPKKRKSLYEQIMLAKFRIQAPTSRFTRACNNFKKICKIFKIIKQ